MGLVNIPIKPMLAISGQLRCDWGSFLPPGPSPVVNTPATPQVSWVKLKPGSAGLRPGGHIGRPPSRTGWSCTPEMTKSRKSAQWINSI